MKKKLRKLANSAFDGDRKMSVDILAFTRTKKENLKFLELKKAACKRTAGTWGLAGGMVDKGEVPVHAAAREFMEETGKTVQADDLVALMKFKIKGQLCLIFAVEVGAKFNPVKKAGKKAFHKEHDDFNWVKLDRWDEPVHPKMERVLKERDRVEQILNATEGQKFLIA